jgi:hypothetical protein
MDKGHLHLPSLPPPYPTPPPVEGTILPLQLASSGLTTRTSRSAIRSMPAQDVSNVGTSGPVDSAQSKECIFALNTFSSRTPDERESLPDEMSLPAVNSGFNLTLIKDGAAIPSSETDSKSKALSLSEISRCAGIDSARSPVEMQPLKRDEAIPVHLRCEDQAIHKASSDCSEVKVDEDVTSMLVVNSTATCEIKSMSEDAHAREPKSIVSRKSFDHQKDRSTHASRIAQTTFRFATSRARTLFAKAGLKPPGDVRELWTAVDAFRTDTVCRSPFVRTEGRSNLPAVLYRTAQIWMKIKCSQLLRKSA